MSMAESTRSKLVEISTATLTTVLFKRGFRNTFIQGIHRINPDGPTMVGPAYTMRYIPAREDIDHLGVFEDRSHPQRKGIEECPPGHVFVIDSRRNPSAASAAGRPHPVRGARRRHSGAPAVEARRGRRGHRRRLPGLAGDREIAVRHLPR